MAFQFPASPSIGQQVVNSASGMVYTWNGTAWSSSPQTASFAVTSRTTVGFPVFSNGLSKFNWLGTLTGNPTASGATLFGNAAFLTGNNYDGVRLTDSINNQNGSVYWSGSSVVEPTETAPIWVSFYAKANGTADGILFHLNANNPITGSSVATTTGSRDGLVVFLDEFNNNTTDAIKVYNSGSLRNTLAPLGNQLAGDFFNRWDLLVFKSGSNYFMNIWQSQNTSTGAPSDLKQPILVSLSGTSASPTLTTINLGTFWPSGGFFGFQAFTGGFNSGHFVNNLQIRSGVLLPDTYWGNYDQTGFS